MTAPTTLTRSRAAKRAVLLKDAACFLHMAEMYRRDGCTQLAEQFYRQADRAAYQAERLLPPSQRVPI